MDYRVYPMELLKLKRMDIYEEIIKCVDTNRYKKQKNTKEIYKLEKCIIRHSKNNAISQHGPVKTRSIGWVLIVIAEMVNKERPSVKRQ